MRTIALLIGLIAAATGSAAGGTGTSFPEIPEAAIRALNEGRHLHASLIIRDWLATAKDTTPDDLLLAARAEAGWSNWERVERLLGGAAWLDSTGGGLGWSLLGRSQYEARDWEASERSFARYLEAAVQASDGERGLAELYRAHGRREAGDIGGAVAAYDRAAALLPSIADWISLYSVAALAATGDTTAVAERLDRIDSALARDWGWRHRVRAHREASDLPGALARARSAASSLPASNRRADAFVEAGRILLELDRADEARDAFRSAIRAAARSTGAIDGARLLSDMAGITPEDQLLVGRTYLRHGNARRGAEGLQAWVDARLGTPVDRDRVRLEIGQALFRAGRHDAAERILTGVANRVNEASTASQALLYVGRAQYRDGRQTQGRQTFLEVAREFPGQRAAPEALYLAADLEHDDGNIDRAVELFGQATTSPTAVEQVGLAHMRLGGIAFQRGDYGVAKAEFDRYRTAYPDGRRYTQATYWSALAARELGDTAAAGARLTEVARLEPLSYYGWRAAELLGRTPPELPMSSSPATDSATVAEVASAMARIDLLTEIAWSDAAAYEITLLRRRLAGSRPARYELAEALNRRGHTPAGIEMGWELFRGHGWDDRLLRIIYPFPFRNIIVAEARERGVDPFVAAGLIRQESMFAADAVSPAGAIGLMQVIPATGRNLARQLGVRRFSSQMLMHAEYNAHLGMQYLAEQFRSFDARLPVVFAAYNAGPHRITRWRQFPEFVDDEQFAERIPFAETRDYVKIVQGNARIYRYLYGAELDAEGTEAGDLGQGA